MFKRNTVIVLGAAASKDFGFPLGSEFKSEIAKFLKIQKNSLGALTFTTDTNRFFCEFGSEKDAALLAAGKITEGIGFSSSIDNFLEMRKTDDDIINVGKAAIAHLIYKYEKRAAVLHGPLPTRPTPLSTRFDGKWVQRFAEICFERCEEKDLPEALSRVTFISFNYDRCIEQFVRLAISALYSVEFVEAGKLVDEHLTVLHPYGVLGKLTSKDFQNDAYVLPARPMATNIKTFTEQHDDQSTLNAIGDELKSAENVVFLGYGFHKQNIDILCLKTNNTPKRIIGTAKGLSNTARDVTKMNLERAFKRDHDDEIYSVNKAIVTVDLFDLDCTQLLDEERLSLIAS